MTICHQLIKLAKNFAFKMQQKNISESAGSCAYFFIISIIPLLVLLTSIIPYTAITQKDLEDVILMIVPNITGDFAKTLINEAYQQSVAVSSLSAIATIWSGALAMLSIIRGLNSIYDVEERRNYILLRLIAAFYTTAMIIIILIMLIIMVFEKVIRDIALSHLPILVPLTSLSTYFKFLIVILIASFAFALVYTFVPSARMNFLFQLPGAVFSAVVWYIFSWLFSLYVDISDHFSIYGSIATPLIMMIWLYCCIYIFFIGAFINRFFHPAVKVLYEDHHHKKVVEKVRKKSTRQLRKPRKYDEFG